MKIAIVAGETSGDVLGAGLIDALRKRNTKLSITGICGPRMTAMGASSIFPMDSISIMGFDDLPARLLKIIRIRKQLARTLISDPPDLFVGIDVPDFNLGLESRLRKYNIKTVHYVSPTVWAWRGYRIKKIRRAVGHMLTLFPFEAEYYRQRSIPVTFVGHPIADEINQNPDIPSLRKSLNVKAQNIVALLPGSRPSELRRLGPLFIDTATRLLENFRDIEFIAPFANDQTREHFAALLEQSKTELNVELVKGRSREVMSASDVVLLASGTAALEAALLCKPMVVSYKVSWLTEMAVRMFARVDYFSMPNHLLEQPVVPELLQSEATPANLAREVSRLLGDANLRRDISQQLCTIYKSLRCNASERAADVILSLL